jgi:1,4-dihydroxy-2-naphthoate octaprenyltransferase
MSDVRAVWTRKLIYPGHTLPTALGPVVVAVGLAWHDGVFAAGPALLALTAGWLIQFAGVVTDNLENLVHQPDDREHPELVEAVNSGLITLSGLRTTILVSYGLATLAGLYLVFLAGWPVIVIGLASIAASWIYSAGPWPVGRHGLADPLFFLFFGVVSVAGTYYVQAAFRLDAPAADPAFSWHAVALGLPIGALITNILIIDDIRDRAFDIVKGKRTIAVRFGLRWSRMEFLGLLVAAYALPGWFWLGLGLGPSVLLPWLTLPFASMLAYDICTRDRFEDLVPMTPRAAQLMLGYAVLLAAGVARAQ